MSLRLSITLRADRGAWVSPAGSHICAFHSEPSSIDAAGFASTSGRSSFRSDRVQARGHGISAAVWELPDEDAGRGLVETPAPALFGLVMPSAKRRQIAFTRSSALVVRQRVVIVALSGDAPAARERAGPLPDLDDVMQRIRDPVTRHLAGVRAGPGLDRTDPHRCQPACPVWTIRRWRAAGAAVRHSPALPVSQRHAPA